MRPAILVLLVLLAGCGGLVEPERVYQKVYLRPEIPAVLQSCAEEPPVPGRPVTEFEALEYVARLRAAWRDCWFKHGQVTGIATGAAEADAREK
jgi:hypothetical protein